jgi:hypothetical protein
MNGGEQRLEFPFVAFYPESPRFPPGLGAADGQGKSDVIRATP